MLPNLIWQIVYAGFTAGFLTLIFTGPGLSLGRNKKISEEEYEEAKSRSWAVFVVLFVLMFAFTFSVV